MRKIKSSTIPYRVISGSLKGVRIVVPDLGVTRPPLTRLRRAISDFMQPYLPGAHFLDLFSGSGSYLFEVVSRGVASATGVEYESRLAHAINKEAMRLEIDERLHCLCDDVFDIIPQLYREGKRYDIIMAAPPQYKGYIDKTLTTLADFPLLAPDGMIICQHDTSETRRISFVPFTITQQRKYGNTTFTILAETTASDSPPS